ncbi:MAG: cytochrome c biogenesis protein ResB [Candidatus Omnitrophica bacterium]|nr:cytochrome c biogenesis protein ResB [Candidatus Omnitrophota bacterium]
MSPVQKTLRNIPLLRFLASLKITVVCLFLLIILTLWGTIAQVDHGLYLAQERFFHSWFFLVFGFLPFPGAQSVLWLLFLNLTAASITRFIYKWSSFGILVIHIGLLLYFVGAYTTLHLAEESQVSLMEGEGTNLSASYQHWEVALWPANQTDERTVTAIDIPKNSEHAILKLPSLDLTIGIDTYHVNAKAYTSASETPLLNASGITQLVKEKVNIEREKNVPGGIFRLKGSAHDELPVLLYGNDPNPVRVKLKNGDYNLMLRRKRYELPFTITLNDFEMTTHPGTNVAKSYKSYATIAHDALSRDIEIYMNHPFRYKDYTLYQASYAIDEFGREMSTLATVKNSGRLIPYVASFVTFGGLMFHFLMMGFKKRS